MLQIKVLSIARVSPEDEEKIASCQLEYNGKTVGISLWESDFKILKEAGLFGRGHRANKDGVINESPAFLPAGAMILEEPETSFADGLGN